MERHRCNSRLSAEGGGSRPRMGPPPSLQLSGVFITRPTYAEANRTPKTPRRRGQLGPTDSGSCHTGWKRTQADLKASRAAESHMSQAKISHFTKIYVSNASDLAGEKQRLHKRWRNHIQTQAENRSVATTSSTTPSLRLLSPAPPHTHTHTLLVFKQPMGSDVNIVLLLAEIKEHGHKRRILSNILYVFVKGKYGKYSCSGHLSSCSV